MTTDLHRRAYLAPKWAMNRSSRPDECCFAIAAMFFAISVPAYASGPEIVFASNRDGNYEIYGIQRDGSAPTNLTNNAAFDVDPVFVPDGRIIFSSDRNPGIGVNKLYVMNGDGSNVQLIPAGVSTAPGGGIFFGPEVLRSPRVSPDGGMIVCVQTLAPGGPPSKQHIWLMNFDGSNVQNLSMGTYNDRDPTFTPDGNHLVFSSDQYGNYEVFIMDLTGANRVRLTNIPNSQNDAPDVSPDGKRITFTSNPSDNRFDVYVMNADGSSPINITNRGAIDGGSVFSPSGDHLLFISDRDGNYEVFSMTTNGDEVTQVTFTQAPASQYSASYRNITHLNFHGFHQFDPTPDVPQYFGPTPYKTSEYGCALTSVANALVSFGSTVTVSQLNEMLLVPDDNGTPIGYSNDSDLYFDAVPRAVAGIIDVQYLFGGAVAGSLDLYLKEHFSLANDRVILKLRMYKNETYYGTHFVLVVGKTGNDWNVYDPGWSSAIPLVNLSSLQGHITGFTIPTGAQLRFEVAEVRTFGLGKASAAVVARVHSPVNMLVTDPGGRRVGIDPATGLPVVDNAGSSFFREDPVANAERDAPSVGDATGVQIAYIPAPIAGAYTVGLNGTATGDYRLDFQNVSSSGGVFTTSRTGTTDAGTLISYQLTQSQPPDCDLSLHISASPETISIGESFTYNLVVNNNGPLTATDVRIVAQLPSNVRLVSSGADKGSTVVADRLVFWNLGTLATGDFSSGAITVTLQDTTGDAGMATVSFFGNDPAKNDNAAVINAGTSNFALTTTIASAGGGTITQGGIFAAGAVPIEVNAASGWYVKSITQYPAANDAFASAILLGSLIPFGGWLHFQAPLTLDADKSVTVVFAPAPPLITAGPQDQIVNQGQSAGFSVTATGAAPLSYHWQRFVNGSTGWNDLVDGDSYSGVTTPNLTVPNVSPAMHGDRFRCLVSNGIDPDATSVFAILSVGIPITYGLTVTQIGSGTTTIAPPGLTGASGVQVFDGRSQVQVTFDAAAEYYIQQITGTPNPGLPDNFSRPLIWFYLSAGPITHYQAQIILDQDTELSVVFATALPIFSSQPVSRTVTVGGSATFTVSAGGASTTSFQWQRDGVDIPNATGAELTIAPATINDAGTYTVIATDSFGSSVSSSATLTVNFQASDFDGDGKSDLLWSSELTDDRFLWLINGGYVTSSVFLGTVGTQWSATTGDFNGDCKSDILWSNSVSGDRYLWLMNGGSVASSIFLGTVATQWTATIGDFDGDGKADILWSNTVNGDRYLWLMNGGTVVSSIFLGTVETQWSATIGDFNGDGKADILWTNTVSGDRYFWLMNGGSVASSIFIGTISTQWIAATGDFDGDGKSDILWSNSSSGDRYLWLMNGGFLASNIFIGTISPQWIAATGDFDGDGKSDILWSNTSSGDRYFWLMNGGSVTTSIFLGTVAPVWVVAP